MEERQPTRILLSILLVLLATSGSSAQTSSEGPEVLGALPFATVKGRLVDAEGQGVAGVRILAQPYHPGRGPDGLQLHIGPTSADGSWEWRAPACAVFWLTYLHPELDLTSDQMGLLRPGKSYDLGTQAIGCNDRLTFRLVSPGGVDLTPFALPNFFESHDGWYSCCSEYSETLIGWPYPQAMNLDPYDLLEGLDESPREVIVPLHSIIRVEYPDGTPVAGARIDDMWVTNADGEFAFCGVQAGATFEVAHGDYSIEIELGEPKEQRVRYVMPRGGDVQFELIADQPFPPPMSWLIQKGDEDARNGFWRTSLLWENLKPGPTKFRSGWDEESHTEIECVVLLDSQIRAKHPVTFSRHTAVVTLHTPSGVPVPDTVIRSGFTETRTDSTGSAIVESFSFGEVATSIWIEADHPKLGYFEGLTDIDENGRATAVLKPWCALTVLAMLPNWKPSESATLELQEKVDGLILWSTSLHGEPPWDERSWNAQGILHERLRAAEYTVTARDRGWKREETITLRDGIPAGLHFELPQLRAITVQVMRGNRPATGEVWLEDPKPEGWEEGTFTELDGEGRATLYTPALDPNQPLRVRLSGFHSWTTPVDGSMKLFIPVEQESPTGETSSGRN